MWRVDLQMYSFARDDVVSGIPKQEAVHVGFTCKRVFCIVWLLRIFAGDVTLLMVLFRL